MQNKEIERLRGTLNVMKHMCNGGDTEVRQKMEKVLKDLRGKEGEIEDVEALNHTLIIKNIKVTVSYKMVVKN